jgi:hypothetical protein
MRLLARNVKIKIQDVRKRMVGVSFFDYEETKHLLKTRFIIV